MTFFLWFLAFCSLKLQKNVDLVHEIEAEIGKELEEFECKEKEVIAEITKVR